MNIVTLLFLFAVVIGAVMGLTLIGSHTQTGVTDTYGNGIGNSSNASQALVGNVSATGTQVGTGAVLLVAGIIGAVVLGALVMVAIDGGKKRF